MLQKSSHPNVWEELLRTRSLLITVILEQHEEEQGEGFRGRQHAAPVKARIVVRQDYLHRSLESGWVLAKIACFLIWMGLLLVDKDTQSGVSIKSIASTRQTITVIRSARSYHSAGIPLRRMMRGQKSSRLDTIGEFGLRHDSDNQRVESDSLLFLQCLGMVAWRRRLT